MTKDFKPGDRVRVYDHNKDGPYSLTGRVVAAEENGSLDVLMDADQLVWSLHKKQCRRLVMTKRRRRVWVNMAEMKNVLSLTNWDRKRLLDFGKPTNTDGWVEFVESRKPAKKETE